MFSTGFSKISAVKVLKELGKGGEGIAHLVDHPRFGRCVRKTYNITGKLFSKPIFEKKLEIYKKVKSPHLSRFLGQEGNKPITYHEYVRFGKKRATPSPERKAVIRSLNSEVKKTTGTGIKDLWSNNLVQDEHGDYKVIDFLLDGPLKQTSRRGQIRAAGEYGYKRARNSGMRIPRSRRIAQSMMGQMKAQFDRAAIQHKSRKEILHNANLPQAQRERLIERATKAS